MAGPVLSSGKVPPCAAAELGYWRRRRWRLAAVVAMLAVGIAASTAPSGGASGVTAQEVRPRLDVILAVADVRAGMSVADIGAGNGDFAFSMANVVGPSGRIYATEISDDGLARIERGRRERKIDHLTVVRSAEADPNLPAHVDRITMVDVYHHLTKPAEFMAAVRKSLKPDGRLVVAAIVHKHAPDLKSNTHDPCVSDPDETRRAIEQAGYIFETLVIHEDPKARFFPDCYALVFRVPSGG